MLRALATVVPNRIEPMPDLPTVSEAGVPGFSTSVWFALWGPANMPPNLVAKLHADISKVLDLPQTREFFKTNSFERVTLSPVQFGELIASDLKHWSVIIKVVGAKLE